MSGLHLRRLHVDADSFILWLGQDDGRDGLYHRSVGVHVDFPWSECVREFGAPMRVNLHLYWWFVLVGARSQVWSRREGNTERWRWVTWHPMPELQCRVVYTGVKFGLTHAWECGRLKGHHGDHA